MARLRLALCQINAVVGDLQGNAARVLKGLREAEEAGAQLAIFPELVVPGYPPEDLLLSPSFVQQNRAVLEEIAAATSQCAAIVGFVEHDRDLYNAAAVCAGGTVRAVYRKRLLPNYAVFDERRWFTPGGPATTLVGIGGVRVGVAICEDAWSPTGPVLDLAAGGAELVVTVNASPYRAGVIHERTAMLSTRAADASCALCYVNLTGGQDELVFDGGSMLFDLDGRLVAAAPQFTETVEIVDFELGEVYRKRLVDPRARPRAIELPVLEVVPAPEKVGAVEYVPRVVAPLAPVEEVYEALVLATHDYTRKNGFTDVVVGLSGGIDSALVATVASDALGPEHVHAVAMPSRFSSPSSLADARALAENLGIDFEVLEIESVHASLLALLAPSFSERAPDLTEENLQARVRGTLLMALSNKFGWLVLTTANKSETAVGYSTLYGDMAGGFAVIKDVPKILVYALCELRNSVGDAVIPREIIDKAPSAELRPDQRDDDTLPPYDRLDPILEGYVEQGFGVAELVSLGHDEATVRRVIGLVDRAEYKRRQAAPGPRVTSRAFGKDRRMPITNGFSPATAPPR
jgi:NAD+ synthase (glutamine-hydrolysing)